jgi:hypothetical protein
VAQYDAVKEARKELRRQVKLAAAQGRTVPYSLTAMIEAHIPVDVIRKVYRRPEDR